MKKISVFVGTRPEAIKMAPVVQALRAMPDRFDTRVWASGQHRELLAEALAQFSIEPDLNLDVMSENQTLAGLSAKLFTAIDAAFAAERPDVALVQGDTTTVAVAALCAFYRGIPVGHVEAGLRSFDILSPFPEEMNRRIATLAARWFFAPTRLSERNLLAEGTPAERVHVTGNTVIDALLQTAARVRATPPDLPEGLRADVEAHARLVLVTAHRRENFGVPLERICAAVTRLAAAHPDILFVYPVHPNPNVRAVVGDRLGHLPNVRLVQPLGYAPFVWLLDRAHIVLSDSGGVQEEGPALGKPVLVMREVTERPEGVEAGVNTLVGTDPDRIVSEADTLLTDEAKYRSVAARKNPFGDGTAGRRIAEILGGDLA